MSDIIQIKVILLGETAVGKTCIISRFISDTYITNHLSTMFGNYSSKTICIDNAKKAIKYDIWDTAGQERYRAMNKMLYSNASVAILVFDITNRRSFEEIKNYWYKEILQNAPKDIIIAIAANKYDLYEDELISKEELDKYAQSINVIYKQTSALKNIGINELFEDIGKKIISSEKYEQLINNSYSKELIKLNDIDYSDNYSDISSQNTSKSNKSNKTKKKKNNCC